MIIYKYFLYYFKKTKLIDVIKNNNLNINWDKSNINDYNSTLYIDNDILKIDVNSTSLLCKYVVSIFIKNKYNKYYLFNIYYFNNIKQVSNIINFII